jgi:predicted permease
MQKCSLCDKKIPGDAKFCPQCGWDLTDHELTPLQVATIQEAIQDARFRYIHWHVVMMPFLTIGLACLLVGGLALWKVIPATWEFMTNVALGFIAIEIAFAFLRDRYRKKQERLKMMLRDRQPSQ